MKSRIFRIALMAALFALLPCILFVLEHAETTGVFGSFVQENAQTPRRAVGIFWTDTDMINK